MPTEFPEQWMIRGEICMISGIGSTASIAHPHIIPRIRQQIWQTVIRSLQYPGIRTACQTMLKKDNGSLCVLVLQLMRVGNSEYSQDVTIFGYNMMMFRRISMRGSAVSLGMKK